MDILLTILIATLVLGFLVFIHEGGHFLAARAFGVRVSEFMIGLPGPSIGVTWKGTRLALLLCHWVGMQRFVAWERARPVRT